MSSYRALPLLLALLASAAAWSIDPFQFDDPAHTERYKTLIEEFRCLQCQNQNLADSDAPLAVDLRRAIADMIRSGRSDDEIRGFLVQRYGDFILYRPPVQPTTWLLWFGPLMLLLVSSATVFTVVRRRSQLVEAPLTESKHEDTERFHGDQEL